MAMMKETMGGTSAATTRKGEKLLAKYVLVDKFGGTSAQWDDWSYSMRRTIRSMNVYAFALMKEAEDSALDVVEGTMTNPESKLRSGELYDILCQK